jgi:hypothetical protein
MDAEALVRRLEAFHRALAGVVAGLTDAELRWKPPDGAWSVLEVLCHLGDEEVADFRPRTLGTLRNPAAEWEKIDPAAWATERKYNEQDPAAALERLTRERAESVRQLRALGELSRVEWSRAYQHPKVGPVPAGAVLAAWAAHDALHLRQIAKRLWELAGRDGSPYPTLYAGEWKA